MAVQFTDRSACRDSIMAGGIQHHQVARFIAGMNPEQFLQCWTEENLNQQPKSLTRKVDQRSWAWQIRWVQTRGSNGSLLNANQHLRRIGPKSNTEPIWRWGSVRPLFMDARKSNEYRTVNDTGAILALLGGGKFESTTEGKNMKTQEAPTHRRSVTRLRAAFSAKQ